MAHPAYFEEATSSNSIEWQCAPVACIAAANTRSEPWKNGQHR